MVKPISTDGGHGDIDKVSAAGLLISMGIVFGDIGTSPLYALQAVVNGHVIDKNLAFGALSCIIWTLTVQTTIKYVIITLRADNRGEGGIFSLYALVRRYRRWLLFPAIIGGGFLLADALLTPPVSVSSSVEGLKVLYPHLDTVPIVIVILVLLFLVQQMGTDIIGKAFGPIMFTWFTFIGGIGFLSFLNHPELIQALNPYYVYNLLANYPGGFWLLGSVFLCTTGAEALYSDMGHCGRANIRVSWMYVKACLILSYMGQCSHLLDLEGHELQGRLFYSIVPDFLLIPSILLATMSSVIASQALISGSFTLVGEAMRLGLWPKMRIVFPTTFKGQLYIPFINWFFMFGCIGVVLHFEESEKMEAAYGLAVSLTMIMTTMLMYSYLMVRRFNFWFSMALGFVFLVVEVSFLVANLQKFPEGGWISLAMGSVLIYVMYVWYTAKEIKKRFVMYDHTERYVQPLKDLSNDLSVPKLATHLIYLTAAETPKRIEKRIVYSIFNRAPKRADVYWFIHINVTDDPYSMSYKVDVKADQDVIFITFNLGFRVPQKLNLYFRMVVEDLVKNNEIDITSRYDSLNRNNVIGDFRFILMQNTLSVENEFSGLESLIIRSYFLIESLGISDISNFGLETSNVTTERIPLVISPVKNFTLTREY